MAFSNDPPVYSVVTVPSTPSDSISRTQNDSQFEECASPTYPQPPSQPASKPMSYHDELLNHVTKKVSAALAENEHQMAQELHKAQETHQELLRSSNYVQQGRALSSTRAEALNEYMNEYQQRLTKHKDGTAAVDNHSVDVEAYLAGSRIAYDQLLESVAEDLGIDDSIYHLGRAYEKQRVDTHTYLKMVRVLARNQYHCREKLSRLQAIMAQVAAVSLD
eukprot:TRINITY_DN8295_c0_g1_i1.p1 TRINITY_DN8295_c0_g1~~TRINITY_DN8295_c0_g1_i1.p1  ORF type:complete len:220 (-),score=4.41 TRINITY_DN8295_c0_g1_i1:374-1033(-)